MTRSTATLTLATKTGTVDTGLPVVVNILLGQRQTQAPASRTFASDYPGRGGFAPAQISKPANAKELVGFQPDNASDLRPPPRWGINE